MLQLHVGTLFLSVASYEEVESITHLQLSTVVIPDYSIVGHVGAIVMFTVVLKLRRVRKATCSIIIPMTEGQALHGT